MDTQVRPATRPHLRRVNAMVGLLLRAPVVHRFVDRSVCELRFAGRRTGRPVVLPVMYARRDDRVVVLVGGPEGKRWWRNFARPHPLRVRLRGVVLNGVGHLVLPGSAERADARDIYASRFPDLPAQDDPFVVITLHPQPQTVRCRGSRSGRT